MNSPCDEEIEKLLRAAPAPVPPPGLRAALEKDVPRPAAGVLSARFRPGGGWWGQWWPVLAAACVTLGCFVVAGVQAVRLGELRRAVAEARALAAVAPEPVPPVAAAPWRDPRDELAALRTRIAALEAELTAAAAPAPATADEPVLTELAADELAFRQAAQQLQEARERSQSIVCVNNLKQLGLAARIWATDNGNVHPSHWLQMQDAIHSPKVLVCPSDTTRTAAADWSAFGPANVSYDFVSPGAPETDPQVVVFRCPFHGHVCLADGSVQQRLATTHPERFQMRNGRLTLDNPEAPRAAVAADAVPYGISPEPLRRYGLIPAAPEEAPQIHSYDSAPVMSAELMRRYGLLPPTNAQVIIGRGEAPGHGTFDVFLEVQDDPGVFVPQPEQP